MKYKYKVIFCLCIGMTLIAALPIINVFNSADRHSTLLSRQSLFNADVLVTPAQSTLTPLKISLNPDKAYFGKHDWIFLGDSYTRNVTTRRLSVADEDKVKAKRLVDGLNHWEHFLRYRGVKAFHVMLGPDKETIYPEYLPVWARKHNAYRTTAIFDYGGSSIIHDPSENLIAAKSDYDYPLYYKSDTHWNALGGWIAYQSFMDHLISTKASDLKRLSPTSVSINGSRTLTKGDLARMLKLNHYSEEIPALSIDKFSKSALEVADFDALSKQQSAQSRDIIANPILIKNTKALNNRKVLWLRDSFGTAVADYMAATFSEIVQYHYHYANPDSLMKLVEKFKPDYVFITAVERQLLTSQRVGLKEWPPRYILSHKDDGNIVATSAFQSMHHSERQGSSYVTTDTRDPYIIFKLDRNVSTASTSKVRINLTCDNHLKNVRIQLWWHKVGDNYFSEPNSIRVNLPAGTNVIDLAPNSNWVNAKDVYRLRIDIDGDSRDSCTKYNLEPPEVSM